MYPCHGLHYYICVLYTCINKSYKSIITPLHLVLWPTVKNKLLQEPLGPTLFLSLLSRRDVMWRENCQISQTRCSHERRNFQSRTKVVYTKVPGKYVVSFLAIDLHHKAMCLSWACKTNRVIAGVRVEQPMCWMSGWCQGQDNDVFAAHSITIRTEGDHPRSIFNGAVQLAIFVLIWIWNCSWLCRWCLKVAAMINPLKLPLAAQYCLSSGRGPYFCQARPQLHHRPCQLSLQRWSERRDVAMGGYSNNLFKFPCSAFQN